MAAAIALAAAATTTTAVRLRLTFISQLLSVDLVEAVIGQLTTIAGSRWPRRHRLMKKWRIFNQERL
jgi:hypothetical protein